VLGGSSEEDATGQTLLLAPRLLLIVAGQLVDFTLWDFTPLYAGEFLTVLSFGASWLVKGWEVRKAVG
jgi:hypothetical protein